MLQLDLKLQFRETRALKYKETTKASDYRCSGSGRVCNLKLTFKTVSTWLNGEVKQRSDSEAG